VRKTVLALAIVALATPAVAQLGGSPNLMSDGVKLKTDEEVKAEEAREKGFKDGLRKIPNAQGKKDPWGEVRGSSPAAAPNQPNASASTKPPATKTSASNKTSASTKPPASNQPNPNTK
jgi:hypothetical protein